MQNEDRKWTKRSVLFGSVFAFFEMFCVVLFGLSRFPFHSVFSIWCFGTLKIIYKQNHKTKAKTNEWINKWRNKAVTSNGCSILPLHCKINIHTHTQKILLNILSVFQQKKKNTNVFYRLKWQENAGFHLDKPSVYIMSIMNKYSNLCEEHTKKKRVAVLFANEAKVGVHMTILFGIRNTLEQTYQLSSCFIFIIDSVFYPFFIIRCCTDSFFLKNPCTKPILK